MKHKQWRRVWRWLVRSILAGLILGLLALATLAAIILHYGAQDRAHPADLIVVLGGGPEATSRRTYHAIRLYEQGYAPYILCSGGSVVGDSQPEARRCARLAIRRGVPAEAVLIEERSLSTEENAIETAAIMRARGWDEAVLVSDNFHLWRARWMFENEGVRVWPSPSQITVDAPDAGDTAYNVLREIAATGWYVGKAILGSNATH